MAEQFVFNLPFRPALDRENFLVAESNRRAVETVDTWPSDSDADCVRIICGPPACGKSHLAAVWGLKMKAAMIAAGDLCLHGLDRLTDEAALVVDAVETLEKSPQNRKTNEEMLFHLINHARRSHRPLLLTSRQAPGHLSIELPDLKSRVAALDVAFMEPPCDMLMRAVLVKLFADRQLKTDEKVISYLAARLERSFWSLNHVVSAIDRGTLSRKAAVSVPMVRQILSEIQAAEQIANEETA